MAGGLLRRPGRARHHPRPRDHRPGRYPARPPPSGKARRRKDTDGRHGVSARPTTAGFSSSASCSAERKVMTAIVLPLVRVSTKPVVGAGHGPEGLVEEGVWGRRFLVGRASVGDRVGRHGCRDLVPHLGLHPVQRQDASGWHRRAGRPGVRDAGPIAGNADSGDHDAAWVVVAPARMVQAATCRGVNSRRIAAAMGRGVHPLPGDDCRSATTALNPGPVILHPGEQVRLILPIGFARHGSRGR